MGEVGVERDEGRPCGELGDKGVVVGVYPVVVDEAVVDADTVAGQAVANRFGLVYHKIVACDEGIVGHKAVTRQEAVEGDNHVGGGFDEAAEAVLGQVEFTPLEGLGQNACVVVVAEDVAVAEGGVELNVGGDIGRVIPFVGHQCFVAQAAMGDDAVIADDDDVLEVGVGGQGVVEQVFDEVGDVVGRLGVVGLAVPQGIRVHDLGVVIEVDDGADDATLVAEVG